MSALRVVVADDEPLAAAVLAQELERAGCTVVAVTATGDAALDACRRHTPDACFIDIVMPGRDGMSVARVLREASPGVAVVFVSAHAHFAVDAFGVDVVDYVLKPARRSRLEEAVMRVRRVREERRHEQAGGSERIVVTERGHVHMLTVREVEWVQADGYSLWLHTATRSWLYRERMHRMESRLAAHGFLRVHRSALVCRTAVVSFDMAEDREPSLLLRSGARVRIARDRVHAVREWLH